MKQTRPCLVDVCDVGAVVRGWCRFHYQRWRRYGDPLRERPTVRDRLETGATRGSGCWLWTGALDSHGYARIKIAGRQRLASRVAWEETYGPIPVGLSVLHACDSPACVRPDHLMVGTQRANIQDMLAKGRRARRAA